TAAAGPVRAMSAPAELFAAIRAHGEAVALDDGTTTWSYRRLLAEVSGWLGVLDAAGARTVAYRLPNGTAWIALDLALLQSGRVAVPLPDFFSRAQQDHVLAKSGA